MPARIFAIDWSGDKKNATRKIWLAEANGAQLVRLEAGRTREDMAQWLLDEARKDPRFVVGLDFAFSFPESFYRKLGAKDVYEVWDRVAAQGERWLSRCEAPFWGRAGRKKDSSCDAFRRTELAVARHGTGSKPKAIFQIGGAGAVGTGSLRGMPMLKLLHDAGFSVWPFDPPGWPLVVEIYPRLLTGPVNKSSREARARYLAKNHPDLSHDHHDAAISCEDAFDAAVSALEMSRRADDFTKLSQASDPCELFEGSIWQSNGKF